MRINLKCSVFAILAAGLVPLPVSALPTDGLSPAPAPHLLPWVAPPDPAAPRVLVAGVLDSFDGSGSAGVSTLAAGGNGSDNGQGNTGGDNNGNGGDNGNHHGGGNNGNGQGNGGPNGGYQSPDTGMIGVPGGGYQRPDTGMIGVPGGGYQRPDTGMIGVGPSYQRPDTGMIGVPGYGYQRPDTGMITVPGGYQRPDTGMITVPGIPGVTDPGDPGDLGVFGPVGNMLAGRGNATGSGSCFYPDLMQLHRLMNRHAYARYVKLAISSHGPATPLHVVIVDFCRDAIAQIVGNANIVTLQKTVTGDAAVRRALSRLGRQPSAVIGLDRVGTKVTLYII